MMLSSSKRGCINHPDNFCYVCGEYTPPAHRVKLNSRITYAYKHYFACQVGNQDKNGPHIFAATVAEQVFYFGWIVNRSKCLLLFPWYGVSFSLSH